LSYKDVVDGPYLCPPLHTESTGQFGIDQWIHRGVIIDVTIFINRTKVSSVIWQLNMEYV